MSRILKIARKECGLNVRWGLTQITEPNDFGTFEWMNFVNM